MDERSGECPWSTNPIAALAAVTFAVAGAMIHSQALANRALLEAKAHGVRLNVSALEDRVGAGIAGFRGPYLDETQAL